MADTAIITEEQLDKFEVYSEEMKHKWSDVLESDGGIANEYMAGQTAIVLENLLTHFQENPVLLAEDEIQSGNFKGINLALIGLLKRTLPKMLTVDMVGYQSMPTPSAPIFYMLYKKSFGDITGDASALSPKGDSTVGQELWGYPQGGEGGLLAIDPYFTSNFTFNRITADVAGIPFKWNPVLASSVRAILYGPDGKVAKGAGNIEAIVHVSGDVYDAVNNPPALVLTDIDGETGVNFTFQVIVTASPSAPTYDVNITGAIPAGYELKLEWEYYQEKNPKMAELTASIESENVTLNKRNMRGRYTFDSLTDAKTLHSINLESELIEMMRIEITNEMNREILTDLMALAAIRVTVDYAKITDTIANGGVNITGNYQDAHAFLLDRISGVCSEIWVQGRLGRGNWVVGNPTTLSFLERVAGFRESGVDYDASTLTYKGNLGKIKFYEDPQFPKDKLLVGFKGTSSLETGYIFAPYQPLIAMPTMLDPMTGDYRKIFQTRYGKTFQFNKEGIHAGKLRSAIYRGGYQYAVMTLKNFPTINFSY